MTLDVTYLGLKLKNPLVASASPMTKKVDLVKRMEDAGISAVVMYSLFEEQIIHESNELDFFLNRGTESYAEALTYFPDLSHYNVGSEGYLNTVRKLKETVDIPVIGSLNGYSVGGWLDYARKIEQAGADALELNIYYLPAELETTAEELENAYVDLVADVRKQIRIPLAVKLSPYFTALPNLAAKLVKAGANGLVLFNRFMQPDLDIENMEVLAKVNLSTSAELRLPLRWVAILYSRIQADLALTTGIHEAQDVVKAIMAGANVAMTASELLSKGPSRAADILRDLERWMEEHEYQSVQQMCGSMSQKAVADPTAFERANYMKALSSYDDRVI